MTIMVYLGEEVVAGESFVDPEAGLTTRYSTLGIEDLQDYPQVVLRAWEAIERSIKEAREAREGASGRDDDENLSGSVTVDGRAFEWEIDGSDDDDDYGEYDDPET